MTKKNLTGYLRPRTNENTQQISRAAVEAVEYVNSLPKEKRAEHYRKVEANIARVNKHSYESNIGQAKTLSKYEHVKYKG